MRITVNGKETIIEQAVNIAELLKNGYTDMLEYVTVQINDEILHKDYYESYYIKENDVIEFLYYMGGGGN